MVSITLNVTPEFKTELKKYSWVNWSEIARIETKKKVIFEKFMKTRAVSGNDIAFCETIDWHPVDELPYKESFIKKIKKIQSEKKSRVKKVGDLFE
ncbi:MAG: hypothetical protein ACMXYE_01155 [Candidatus Woesearchaeota archaeon]